MEKKQVIYDFYAAINDGDLEALFKCFHKKNSAVVEIKEQYRILFEQYKVNSKILNCQVIGEDENNIIIKDQVDTIKISGPVFKDNQTKSIYILEKEADSNWTILSSSLIEVSYF